MQVSLLTEQETTKVLRILTAVSVRLGLDKELMDGELREMVGNTPVGELAEKLALDLARTREVDQHVPAAGPR